MSLSANIKSAVVVCICSVTDTLVMVTPIGEKFCMMVHIGPRHKVSPFGGGTPKGSRKSKMLAI